MVTVLPRNSRTVGNGDLSIKYTIRRKKMSVFRYEIAGRFRCFIADSNFDEKFVRYL